jgi:hypothetical protein
MKIQQNLEREPFGEIIEQTLGRFFKNMYGGEYAVRWYAGSRCGRLRGKSDAQIWLCNPALNALFTADTTSEVLKWIRRQYSHAPIVWRRPLQRCLVALATHGSTAAWFTSAALGVSPAIPNGNRLLLLGGNNRLRLADMRQARVYSVLKQGFDPVFLRREISVRQAGSDWPIPPLLEYAADFTWFAESLVDAVPLNRVSSRKRRLAAATQANSVLARWCERSRTEIAAQEYVQQLGELAQRRVSANSLFSDQERRTVRKWVASAADVLSTLAVRGGKNIPLTFGHGDFQPGNILLNNSGHIWLTDWEHADKRHVLYDAFVYGLASRFPGGLALRMRSALSRPSALGLAVVSAWPEIAAQDSFRLRLQLGIFLLEELLWYLEENSNHLFRKLSGGWLDFRGEFEPALAAVAAGSAEAIVRAATASMRA